MLASLGFLLNTRRIQRKMEFRSLNQFGQNFQIDLPPSGLLSEIDVLVKGTITTGTGTSGNWDPNYWPWNLFQRIQLTTNVGFNILNLLGYSNFLFNSVRMLGRQVGISIPPISGGWNNTSNVGPRTNNIYPTGALADSHTYPIQIHYKIPVTTDKGLGMGLVLLENQFTRCTLMGTINMPVVMGNLGSGASISLTVMPMPTVWQTPTDLNNLPQDSMASIQVVEDETKDWTVSGQQIYDVVPSGTYLRIIADIQNNGAPEPFYGTASDPNDPNFGDVQTVYATSQTPENMDFEHKLQDMYETYGYNLPQGCLVFDYATLQSLELGTNLAGTAYNTSNQTQFGVRMQINDTPTNGSITYIKQRLERRVA